MCGDRKNFIDPHAKPFSWGEYVIENEFGEYEAKHKLNTTCTFSVPTGAHQALLAGPK